MSSENSKSPPEMILLPLINIGFIIGLLFSMEFIIVDLVDLTYPKLRVLILMLLLIGGTALIPLLFPLGPNGKALAIIWLVFNSIIATLMVSLDATEVILLGFILALITWTNFLNHYIINGVGINIQFKSQPSLNSQQTALNIYKFEPKSEGMEMMVVLLAFLYLNFCFIVYVIGFFLEWNPALLGLTVSIIGLFALDFFWYATRYSRKVTLLAILMGNIVLIISIVLDYEVFAGFEIIVSIIILNIGFTLLGAPTSALKKDDILRKFLIFNWIAWSVYFSIGLIISVYDYDPSVFIEFLTGFSEVSMITAGAYKDTIFWNEGG